MKKMKVEIWSDVMCPFCYIGKKRFDQSLIDANLKDVVDVEWKSFQLNPTLRTDPSISINEYLAANKEMSVQQAKDLNTQLADMAAKEGLEFNFDKAIVANSFKAHVLTHLAKKYGKQDEVEELLFQAYFTLGHNIDDLKVLAEIGSRVGISEQEYLQVLESNLLQQEVNSDIREAAELGVRGVPFFVYDRKYAISGAQATELFVQTLQKAYQEWAVENSGISIENGDDASSCGIDGC